MPTDQSIFKLRNKLAVVSAICVLLSLMFWVIFLLLDKYSVGIVFRYCGIVLTTVGTISTAAWLFVVFIFFSRFRLSHLLFTSIAVGGTDWLLTSKIRFLKDAGVLAALGLIIFVLIKLIQSGDQRYLSLMTRERFNSRDNLAPDLQYRTPATATADQSQPATTPCNIDNDDRPVDF